MPTDASNGLSHSTRSTAIYDEVCRPNSLRRAYDLVASDPAAFGIDVSSESSDFPPADVDLFLRELRDDLTVRTYQPASPNASESLASGQPASVRDAVVCAGIHSVLAPLLSAGTITPEEAAAQIASAVGRGLTRVDAVDASRALEEVEPDVIIERVARRIDDPDLIALLAKLLAEPASVPKPLAALLAGVALDGVDGIFEQAMALSRDGDRCHLHCIRSGSELVVLSDRNPQFVWLLPATEARLHSELGALRLDPDLLSARSVDLVAGSRLRMFGHEFRVRGRSRVEYTRVDGTTRQPVKQIVSQVQPSASSDPSAVPQLLRFGGRVGRCVWWSLRCIGRACQQLQAIQVRYEYLVIAPWAAVRMAGKACRQAQAVQLRREHLLIAPWAVVRMARLRWSNLVVAGCVIVALTCMTALGYDLYTNRSHETPIHGRPAGFYLGQYNAGSMWNPSSVPYGLYIPPHFQNKPGPFPLIVFLHGYGERKSDRIFNRGLPETIANQFGERGNMRRFEFIALFPNDPTGKWVPGTPAVNDAMQVVDRVVRHHRIDPSRVYLTGASNGGNGVWRLAEAYPDKWAAVVPVCAFEKPTVRAVQAIPAWVFHGAEDEMASVDVARALVQELKQAGADVRYTEYPHRGHSIWPETYKSNTLYKWLASKKRP